MKVVALATPAFALPTLDALFGAGDVELTAVITNPDRPRGRGLKTAAPAAKEWAAGHDVPVYQPAKLTRAEVAAFPDLDFDCDALVVVASAFFVPGWLRDAPRYGAVNLHPSLLPELRGPAPINWAVIRGLRETGVTTILLAEEMDAGDILKQETVAVRPRETAGTLGARLAETGAALMVATLRELVAGKITPAPQNHRRATYAPKITSGTQTVDWSRPADELDRLVRGLHPEPLARAAFRGENVQLVEAEPAAGPGRAPGDVLSVTMEGVTVACGAGALRLLRVKPAAKNEMSAHSFAQGRRLRAGDTFG